MTLTMPREVVAHCGLNTAFVVSYTVGTQASHFPNSGSPVHSSQGWWQVTLDKVWKVLRVVPDSLHAHGKLVIIKVAELRFISS